MDASAHVHTNTAVGSPTRIAPALAPVSLAFAVSVCAMSIRGSRQGSCGGSRPTLHVAPRPASSTLPLQLVQLLQPRPRVTQQRCHPLTAVRVAYAQPAPVR